MRLDCLNAPAKVVDGVGTSDDRFLLFQIGLKLASQAGHAHSPTCISPGITLSQPFLRVKREPFGANIVLEALGELPAQA